MLLDLLTSLKTGTTSPWTTSPWTIATSPGTSTPRQLLLGQLPLGYLPPLEELPLGTTADKDLVGVPNVMRQFSEIPRSLSL